MSLTPEQRAAIEEIVDERLSGRVLNRREIAEMIATSISGHLEKHTQVLADLIDKKLREQSDYVRRMVDSGERHVDAYLLDFKQTTSELGGELKAIQESLRNLRQMGERQDRFNDDVTQKLAAQRAATVAVIDNLDDLRTSIWGDPSAPDGPLPLAGIVRQGHEDARNRSAQLDQDIRGLRGDLNSTFQAYVSSQREILDWARQRRLWEQTLVIGAGRTFSTGVSTLWGAMVNNWTRILAVALVVMVLSWFGESLAPEIRQLIDQLFGG